MRKKVMFLIMLVMFSFIIFQSCTKKWRDTINNWGTWDIVKETPLGGEYSLVKVGKAGTFFLEAGPKLKFYWMSAPGEIATALSYNKLQFVIDESRDIPTVKFVFYDSLRRYYKNAPCCKQEILARLATKYGFNAYVTSKYLRVAKVRISRATLEKEGFLSR